VWRSAGDPCDIYDGEYLDDMKHGHGKYVWTNGSKYEGMFRQDKKHGRGTIVHENGKISNLEW
jgi:hypothetical protein